MNSAITRRACIFTQCRVRSMHRAGNTGSKRLCYEYKFGFYFDNRWGIKRAWSFIARERRGIKSDFSVHYLNWTIAATWRTNSRTIALAPAALNILTTNYLLRTTINLQSYNAKYDDAFWVSCAMDFIFFWLFLQRLEKIVKIAGITCITRGTRRCVTCAFSPCYIASIVDCSRVWG